MCLILINCFGFSPGDGYRGRLIIPKSSTQPVFHAQAGQGITQPFVECVTGLPVASYPLGQRPGVNNPHVLKNGIVHQSLDRIPFLVESSNIQVPGMATADSAAYGFRDRVAHAFPQDYAAQSTRAGQVDRQVQAKFDDAPVYIGDAPFHPAKSRQSAMERQARNIVR